MQYIKHILFILLLLAAWPAHLFGQNIWRNIYVVGGGALSEQDRRLFQYLFAQKILNNEPKKLDYDLTLYLNKNIVRYGPTQLDIGIGYAETNIFFGRPYNHFEVGGPHTYDVRYIKKYTINKLVAPISGKINIGKFYLQLSALPAFCVRKSVSEIWNKRLTKWQFNWNSLEINPGLGFQVSQRLEVSFSYRWLFYNEVDKVKFYFLLDDAYDLEILHQKTDTYNPFKMWLTVGYKWKK